MSASAGVLAWDEAPEPDFDRFYGLRIRRRAQGIVQARIHDAAGRLVRTVVNGSLPARTNRLVWDGRDAQGRKGGVRRAPARARPVHCRDRKHSREAILHP